MARFVEFPKWVKDKNGKRVIVQDREEELRIAANPDPMQEPQADSKAISEALTAKASELDKLIFDLENKAADLKAKESALAADREAFELEKMAFEDEKKAFEADKKHKKTT